MATRRIPSEERRAERERTISLFNGFPEALYNRPGELIVDVVESRYSLKVDIERRDSQGVEQMKVFLYDLTLATLWAEKHSGPGFLIHDSTIYADVDERQKAHALELAARMADAHGFQYICCLNSGAIPESDFSKDFRFQQYEESDSPMKAKRVDRLGSVTRRLAGVELRSRGGEGVAQPQHLRGLCCVPRF